MSEKKYSVRIPDKSSKIVITRISDLDGWMDNQLQRKLNVESKEMQQLKIPHISYIHF